MPWDTLLRLFMKTAFKYFNSLASWNHKRINKKKREEREKQKRSISICQNKKATSIKTAWHI